MNFKNTTLQLFQWRIITPLLIITALLVNQTIHGSRFTLPKHTIHYSAPGDIVGGGMGFLQAKSGLIYMGSWQGLTVYDGNTFEFLSDPSSGIQNVKSGPVDVITEDSNGNIWCGGRLSGGLAKYNPETKTTRRFFKSESENGLSSNMISGIYEDSKNNIWVTTSDYVLHKYIPESESFLRFDLKSHYPIRDTEWSSFGEILEDDEGNLFIASRFGLSQFNPESQVFIVHQLPRIKWYPYVANPLPLYKSEENHIWMGYFGDEGCWVFDIQTKKWITQIRLDESNALNPNMQNVVNTILPLNDSLLALQTLGDGIWIVNKETYDFRVIKPGELDIPSEYLWGLFTDSHNNLYITYPDGVTILYNYKTPFNHLKPEHLSDKLCFPVYITDFTSDTSSIYISTRGGDGIIKFELSSEKVDVYRFQSQECISSETNIDNIVNYKDTLFTSVWSTIYYSQIGSDSFQILNYDVASENAKNGEQIYKMGIFDDFLYYYQIGSGLRRFSLKTKISVPFGTNSAIFKNSHILRFTKGNNDNLWIGTEQGLFMYHLESNTIDSFKINLDGFPLEKISITDIYPTDSCAWITTIGHGLLKLTLLPDNNYKIDKYTNHFVPVANNQFKIDPGPGNRLFIVCESGLTIFNPEDQGFIQYSYKDNLEQMALESNQYFFKGKYFISCGSGFAVSQADALIESENNLELYVRNVRVNGNSISSNNYIVVPPGNSHITVNMGVMGYENLSERFFRYRINQSKKWNYVGKNEKIDLPYLDFGKQSITFQVANLNGIWSSQTAEIIFNKKRYLYETPWFWIGLSGLGILLFFYFYDKRQRKQNEIAELKRRKTEAELSALRAQMNPHFIFNCLNSIQWFIRSQRTKEASTYLSKFSKLIRFILQNSQHPFITLEAELKTLELYLSMEKMRLNDKLEYKIEIEESIDLLSIDVPPLMLQPYVENSIWHGIMPKESGGIIWVRIKERGDALILEVEDNGVGRNSKESKNQQQSKGMIMTSRRIRESVNKKNHTDVTIIDLKQNDKPCGTLVRIKYPIL